jgi:hypothetical protein
MLNQRIFLQTALEISITRLLWRQCEGDSIEGECWGLTVQNYEIK